MASSVASLEQSLTDMQLNGSLIANKVFVGGLAEQTETKDLRELFTVYAPVQDVKIIVDRSVTSKSGDPRRYAFIAFETVEDVRKVLNELADKALDLHGRRLTVGQAFRKNPTNRLFAGFPGPFIPDPYALYRAAVQLQYSPFKQPNHSPISPGMPLGPYYYQMDPYGLQSPLGLTGHGYMQGNVSSPQTPTYPVHQSIYSYGQKPTVNGTLESYMNMVNNASVLDDSEGNCVYPGKSNQANGQGDPRLRNQTRMGALAVPAYQQHRLNPSTQPNGPGHYIHQGPPSASIVQPDRYMPPGMRQSYIQ